MCGRSIRLLDPVDGWQAFKRKALLEVKQAQQLPAAKSGEIPAVSEPTAKSKQQPTLPPQKQRQQQVQKQQAKLPFASKGIGAQVPEASTSAQLRTPLDMMQPAQGRCSSQPAGSLCRQTATCMMDGLFMFKFIF